MDGVPPAPGARRAVLVSVAAVIGAGILLYLLAPMADDHDWDLRVLLLIPAAAGAVAPRMGAAPWSGAATAAVFLAGVWVRGPHTECPEGPRESPSAIGPAMQGCFDQPEIQVALWGLAAVFALGALFLGAVVGSWLRGWGRRA